MHNMFEQMLPVKSMMDRCPSCFANFFKIWCHMTCRANQKEFINITKQEPSKDSPGKYSVKEITYFMSSDLANNIYDSCANVSFPSGNQKITDLLCLYHPCDAKGFIGFLGKNGPFDINFIFANSSDYKNGTKPLNVTTPSCTDAPYPYANGSCSCVDCPKRCDGKENLICPFSEPFNIWGVDGMWIIMGIIYFVIIIIGTGGFIFYYHKSSEGNK